MSCVKWAIPPRAFILEKTIYLDRPPRWSMELELKPNFASVYRLVLAHPSGKLAQSIALAMPRPGQLKDWIVFRAKGTFGGIPKLLNLVIL